MVVDFFRVKTASNLRGGSTHGEKAADEKGGGRGASEIFKVFHKILSVA
jgi:hypothetical protein